MNTKLPMRATIALAALIVCAPGTLSAATAPAASWAYIQESSDGEFTITYKRGQYDLDVSPAKYLVDGMWYYNGNVNPQSPSTIQQIIVEKYNITPPTTLTFVSACDSARTCAASSLNPWSSSSTASGNTGTFTSSGQFDYLAVHLGKGQLIFHWSQPISAFTLASEQGTNWSSNISNYRAYLTTPIPGGLLLFTSALGVLAAARRVGRSRS